MDISFFGVRVRLERSQNNLFTLGFKDVADINDNVVRYLKSLSYDEIQERISSVSFFDLSDVESVKKSIDQNGIVIIPDFIPAEVMQRLQPFIDSLKNKVDSFANSDDSVLEHDSALLQKGLVKLRRYNEMASYGKAVVHVRKGQDEGMVDIFNVDKWFEEIGSILRPFFESPDILSILDTVPGCVEAKNLNFYFNKSITKTRGFHVDSYSKQLKGFVYLTDVLSLGDGPYTYVKGGHLDSAFRRINKAIASMLPSKTESPVVPLSEIVPVLAPKGALVISDQGGAHRGHPQTEGEERAIAVMNYK